MSTKPWMMLSVALMLLAQTEARASSFSVTPILVDMPLPARIATYTISNPGNTPLQVQVEGNTWTQQNGADIEQPAAGLTISPPMAVIPPGGSQVIRVARPAASALAEQAFRIHFDEIPSATQNGGVLLQTLLRMDVPLFFTPGGKSRPATRWAVANGRTPGQLAIGAINDGAKFDRYSAIALYDSSGALLLRMKRPLYVLAHSNRIWIGQTAHPLRQGESVLLVVEQNGATQEHRITVD